MLRARLSDAHVVLGGTFHLRTAQGAFEARKNAVEEELSALQRTLEMIQFKCWYCEAAIEDGNEERLTAMIPDALSPEIQKLYDSTH